MAADVVAGLPLTPSYGPKDRLGAFARHAPRAGPVAASNAKSRMALARTAHLPEVVDHLAAWAHGEREAAKRAAALRRLALVFPGRHLLQIEAAISRRAQLAGLALDAHVSRGVGEWLPAGVEQPTRHRVDRPGLEVEQHAAPQGGRDYEARPGDEVIDRQILV